MCPGRAGKRWAGVPVARRVTEGGAPDRRAAGRAFVQTGREAGEVRPAERRVTEGHLIEGDGGAGHPSEERAEQPGCGCASAAKRVPAAKRAGRAIVVRPPYRCEALS